MTTRPRAPTEAEFKTFKALRQRENSTRNLLAPGHARARTKEWSRANFAEESRRRRAMSRVCQMRHSRNVTANCAELARRSHANDNLNEARLALVHVVVENATRSVAVTAAPLVIFRVTNSLLPE
jgi:hypothetical protein